MSITRLQRGQIIERGMRMNLTNLQQYIGSKIVNAGPMNLGDYNDFRGWEIPSNEDPARDGYIVQYPDGYISWAPEAAFEEANRLTSGMSFGLAIEAMRKGLKVARAGWNGKGMYIYFVRGIITSDSKEETLPYFGMWTVNAEGRRATLKGWLASQTDMAADDWQIVE